jgi:predicted dehydrogenase
MIHVGLGGWGTAWCRHILAPFIEEGAVEVVAAVDRNPEALAVAREALGLPAGRCYTDPCLAFAESEADFCTVVTTPDSHEQIVDLALEHGMDILSEKPIADTLEASCRIADKVARAGSRMGVTMSHRFDQDKTTLREEVRSGRWGALDYVVCRFTCDCRRFGSWGRFRHEIPDALMVEGAVHHLDLIADLAGGRCESLYAETWNPRWGEFAGDSQGLVLLHMDNGTRATYEGAKTNAAGLNCWTQEYLRAECELGTLVLDRRKLEAYPYDAGGVSQPIALRERKHWQNRWLLEQFLAWREGGAPMETNVEANLQSVALVFSAIESSLTGRPVRVQEHLAEARARCADPA